MESSTEAQQASTPPGWYTNPDAPGQRYYNGERWTESYYPAERWDAPPASAKEVLWGLSLGFGATGGVVGFLSIPVIAFYFPLGFGVGGLALAIAAAITKEGSSPWWAAVAVIGSIAALGLGIDAYSQFNDAQDSLRDLNF